MNFLAAGLAGTFGWIEWKDHKKKQASLTEQVEKHAATLGCMEERHHCMVEALEASGYAPK